MTPRRHKFNAAATELDGIRFASRAEARRYSILAQKLDAGVISDLRLQPRFFLRVNGHDICEYRADFAYTHADDGRQVVEDVKGVRTREYQIKTKLLKALHGIEVVEIPA